MFKVIYSYYGKYQHEKVFASQESAKKFFWYIQKRNGVTRVEMNPV
jgi:hypothetical protein